MVRARPLHLFLFPHQNSKFIDLLENSEMPQPVLGRSFIRKVPISRRSKGAVRSKLSPWGLEGACPDSSRQGLWWDMLIKTGRCGPASLSMYI